jgi:hypothetical protein
VWIGENLQEELGFSEGTAWHWMDSSGAEQYTASPHRGLCLDNVWVYGKESDLFRGVIRARCYPFKMPKHLFHESKFVKPSLAD